MARLRAAAALANPRRILRHFRSVSRRLDDITRLVHAESAAAVDRGLRLELEWERRLGEMEQRLSQSVTSGLDRFSSAQASQAESLRAAVADCADTIKSLNLDRWKVRDYEGLLRYLRRQDYFRAIEEGRLAVPSLETEHPVAISSNDTRFPRGCKNDNSIAPRFNHKLYQFFGRQTRLRVLDLGCAGGGFVRSLLDQGHFAVGLEGSDYPLVNQTMEWSTIPRHLFTCDITKPFRLTDRATNQPLAFDAITGWEVMEHIPQEELAGLFENIDRHLSPDGVLLFSIATFLDWDPSTGVVWHVTVKPRTWWEDRFAEFGFEVEEDHPFGKDDWLRGSGQCRGDWHEDEGLGFHVVLRRKVSSGSIPSVGNGIRALVA
jgi:SAM-dependent methyltransferase